MENDDLFNKPTRDYQDDIASWNAARIIGEIFGWEHLNDQEITSLGNHLPEGFDPKYRSTWGGLRDSIYNEIFPLWAQCTTDQDDFTRNDFSPLSPSNTINHNLLALVSIICTRFASESPTDQEAQDTHHYQTVKEVLDRLHNDPALKEKLGALRDLTGYAEGEMERYYNKLAIEKFQSSEFPEQHKLADGASEQERIDALKKVVEPFPYPDNYEKMTDAEVRLMTQPLDPQFFRIDDIEANDGLAGKIDTVRKKAAGLMDALTGERSLERKISSPENLSITFPGSGCLPLTGLMLHIRTGAKINLIDIDPDAIKQSKALIDGLEELNIINKGAVQVIEGNIVNMRYHKEPDPNAQTLTATQVSEKMSTLFPSNSGANVHKVHAARNEVFTADLPQEGFSYTPHYSLPDKNTPYAISFTGYKEVTENGETYKLSHQIYFDKDRGWKCSQNRRFVPSDAIFMASLIPEELRQQAVDTILRQTETPDTLVMRSVKGLAQLVYPPTRTNHLADTRSPFYGEAVSQIHTFSSNTTTPPQPTRGEVIMMYPQLVQADSEVLNSTEITYLPFARLLRERADHHDQPVDKRLDQMADNLDKTTLKINRLKALAEQEKKALAEQEEKKALAEQEQQPVPKNKISTVWALGELRNKETDRQQG